MEYATIRVKEISAARINRANIHNERLYDELDYTVPANIDSSQSGMNKNSVFIDGEESDSSYKVAMYHRIEKAKAPMRKNSVLGLEYVFSASSKFLKAYTPEKYFASCVKFLEKKHGKENIIAIAEHYDELKPHVHIIVVPIIRKEIHWKCRKGDGFSEGTKEENRLCARDFTGNRMLLSRLQDDFYAYNLPAADECGVDITRGTSAGDQDTLYVENTSHKIGVLAQQFDELAQKAQQCKLDIERGLKNIEECKKVLEEAQEKYLELDAIREKEEREFKLYKQEKAIKEERDKQFDRARKEKEQETKRLDKAKEQETKQQEKEAKEKEIKRLEREAKEKELKKGHDFGIGGMGM
jgi:hypothetical protein